MHLCFPYRHCTNEYQLYTRVKMSSVMFDCFWKFTIFLIFITHPKPRPLKQPAYVAYFKLYVTLPGHVYYFGTWFKKKKSFKSDSAAFSNAIMSWLLSLFCRLIADLSEPNQTNSTCLRCKESIKTVTFCKPSWSWLNNIKAAALPTWCNAATMLNHTVSGLT